MARDLKAEYLKFKEYNLQYQRENLRQFKFVLNKATESELIAWLQTKPNKQNYIRELIYKDMYESLANNELNKKDE